MKLDLSQMPFSRYGSYVTVMEYKADCPRRPAHLLPGVWLSGVHGFHSGREAFRITLWKDGSELPFTVEAQSSHLVFRASCGTVELCIAEPELLRFRCQGVELRLLMREGKYNYVIAQSGRRWLFNTAQSYLFYTAYPLSGEFKVENSKTTGTGLVLKPHPGEKAELALHQHVGFVEARPVNGSFDDALQQVAKEFDAFAKPYLRPGSEWNESIERAAFLNWSCVVGPRGHFKRPSMLMSKNWMSNVWSWDHAINALALSEDHPELAWDQMMTVFDQQLPTGQLPDFVNDAVRLYNYVKPPVHGWILGLMMERNPWFSDPDRLAAFYEKLENWTEWWFRFRMREGLGLPEYYHGNDSGWDNGTVFDAGTAAAAPDAAAFLVLQMGTLAKMARLLGKKPELAERWMSRSEDLLQKLLRHLWNGKRFVTINAEGGIAEKSDSVFGALPIVLGKRLPCEIRNALAAEIRRHQTCWGLATENPNSALYEPEGYWRGPIWAPPTMIIVEGLRDAGEKELAGEIALKFCRLCKNAGSFAENFNAVSGQPLCDPAYTWTASVFLEMQKSVSSKTHSLFS